MTDIVKNIEEFYHLTGMLPPGHDETAATVGQTHYERHEVRWLLWELYLKMKHRRQRVGKGQTNGK